VTRLKRKVPAKASAKRKVPATRTAQARGKPPDKRATAAEQYFASPEAWRRWLERHHASRAELWVGFHRRETGRPSLTWPQSVDEALCFGWIDGVRQRVDDTRYRIRFTPRRERSYWSAVNLKRMQELVAAGRVTPAGMRAYEARDESRAEAYSFEQRHSVAFAPEDEARFRREAKAWSFFESCPPYYRRTTTFWVVSAKREETRQKRLATLIEDSAAGRRIAGLRREKQ
jgi:uncharacterized protein YdeI (YjbR/CyaY-like superfamily)